MKVTFTNTKISRIELNPVARISHQKPAHHRGNGPAGAQVGHGGMRAGRDLGQHGHHPAHQVENQSTAPRPIASSISGPKAHKKIMLPMMCDQLACMNIAVRIVIKRWPEEICAGIADHAVTNASPPINSRTNTSTFTRMMRMVTMGTRVGRRDASSNGIKPPIQSSSM